MREKKKHLTMNNIEKLFDELLLPLTSKTTESKAIKLQPITPIYEKDTSPICHEIQLVSPKLTKQSVFNLGALLGQISFVPTLTDSAKTLLQQLSDRMNACKRYIAEAKLTEPLNQQIFEQTMMYLYYIGELLPIIANNREPFIYALPENEEQPFIQHTSLVFEYLVTLWGLISHFYSHMNLVGGAEDDVIYKKHVNGLDFCIHVLREMLTYTTKIENNQLGYHRFIYRPSPSSISNKTIESETENFNDLEAQQHEKDVSLITTYFGGSRGINARLHLFYAKKYEFSLKRALFKTGIKNLHGNDEDLPPLVTKENAGHLVAFAGVALQISQHYVSVTKKITDEQCNLYHYAFFKSIYWQCTADFLKASIDFFQYTQREERIEYGKQALKRAEKIKSCLDSFGHLYYDNKTITDEMAPLKQRMMEFHERVNYLVKIVNHRSSEGVTLVPIEETMADESKNASTYQEQIQQLHQKLCENDESGVVKQSLKILYKLKALYIDKLNGGSALSDTSNEVINAMPIKQNNITTDDYIKVALSYERYNWLSYLAQNIVTDTNGDRIILIKEIGQILEDLAEVKEAVKENLLRDRDNETSTAISNKLSSHLYF